MPSEKPRTRSSATSVEPDLVERVVDVGGAPGASPRSAASAARFCRAVSDG